MSPAEQWHRALPYAIITNKSIIINIIIDCRNVHIYMKKDVCRRTKHTRRTDRNRRAKSTEFSISFSALLSHSSRMHCSCFATCSDIDIDTSRAAAALGSRQRNMLYIIQNIFCFLLFVVHQTLLDSFLISYVSTYRLGDEALSR